NMSRHGVLTIPPILRRALMADPRTSRTPATIRALATAAAMLMARGAIAQAPIPAPVVPLPPPPRVEPAIPEADPLPEPLGDDAPVLSGGGLAAGTIEVKVGQGRFLTFPEDLAQPGKQ